MFSHIMLLTTLAFLISVASAQDGRLIHPNGNTAKCLDVRDGLFFNGNAVQIFDCNGNAGQRWEIFSGITAVSVQGTNFCLDAGDNPASGVGMKIWTCFPDLTAQTWSFAEQKIALFSFFATQCLDLTKGILDNGNQVQTWECSQNNPNQLWTVE